jgi:hypothetical protein
MCELDFIEYNPTFDSIIPFPCFFDVIRKTSKVIFNNCHLFMTLKIGLHNFFWKCLKNVGQDSVSGIVRLEYFFFLYKIYVFFMSDSATMSAN